MGLYQSPSNGYLFGRSESTAGPSSYTVRLGLQLEREYQRQLNAF